MDRRTPSPPGRDCLRREQKGSGRAVDRRGGEDLGRQIRGSPLPIPPGIPVRLSTGRQERQASGACLRDRREFKDRPQEGEVITVIDFDFQFHGPSSFWNEIDLQVRKQAVSDSMEYSTEDDPSNPGKFRVTVDLPNGGQIEFTQLDGVPSQDEFAAWVERYEEAAFGLPEGDPLIVDVVAAGLRTK